MARFVGHIYLYIYFHKFWHPNTNRQPFKSDESGYQKIVEKKASCENDQELAVEIMAKVKC